MRVCIGGLARRNQITRQPIAIEPVAITGRCYPILFEGVFMKNVDFELRNAIRAGKPFKKANTVFNPATGEIRLHGSLIGQVMNPLENKFPVQCSFAGYLTNTTRNRINGIRAAFGLPPVSIAKKHAPDANEWF